MDHLVDTFLPTTAWIKLEESQRIKIIQDFLVSQELEFQMQVTSAPDNGQVVLTTTDTLPPGRRGLFLLRLENTIKEHIDIGITLWLEPVGDKSKLRQLRGVTINH